jgi:hypothetical protein
VPSAPAVAVPCLVDVPTHGCGRGGRRRVMRQGGGMVSGAQQRRRLAWIAAVIIAVLAVGAAVVIVTRKEPAQVACTQRDVQRAVDRVSEDKIRTSLQRLVQGEPGAAANEVVSRHVSSPGNAAAVAWISETLAEAGVSTKRQSFRSDGHRLANVVATVAGADRGVRFGVGAHLDSTSEQESIAPGADDNASGVAAVMEAARVIGSVPSSCLKASIDFVAFNDEEEGMEGSVSYAKSVRQSMRGFVNLDMIGNGATPCVITSYNRDRDAAIAAELADANRRHDVDLQLLVRRYMVDDQDGSSFWDEELPVSYVYECSPSPHYHRSTDQVQYLNVGQIALTTKVVVAALLHLAGQS